MPGPTRNRSSNLSRERDANRSGRPTLTTGVARPVVWPEPKADWHEIARMVWDAARNSGQADYYQQSDVAVLYSLMDDLSFYKQPFVTKDGDEYHKRSGQMLQTIMSALKDLLLTEGDRRRLSLELSAPPSDEPAASVAVMDDYRTGLSVVPDLPKTD